MKNRITLLILLMTIMVMRATAIENFEKIRIAGIEVTKENKDNVEGPCIRAYDTSKPYNVSIICDSYSDMPPGYAMPIYYYYYTVYLSNVVIDGSVNNAPAISCDGYKLEVIYMSDCLLKSDKETIRSAGNCIVKHNSNEGQVLYLESKSSHAISVDGSSLEINGRIQATAKEEAIIGNKDKTALKTGSAIRLKATSEKAAITGFKSVKIAPEEEGVYSDVTFSSSTENGYAAYYPGTDELAKTANIRLIQYLNVGNILVSDFNKDNITGSAISALDPDKDYKVWYDSATEVLTLENAVIDASWAGIDIMYGDAHSVTIKGNGKILADMYGIQSVLPLTIDVGGTDDGLIIKSVNFGINQRYSDLTLKSGLIQVEGKMSAMEGTMGYTISCTNKTVLKAYSEKYTISGFSDFSIPDGVAIDPEGATIKYDLGGYYLRRSDGSRVTGWVYLAPTYPVKVAGHQLSSLDDLKNGIVAEGIEGIVTYDVDENTLTLEDATITATTDESDTGIEFGESETDKAPTIILKGKNTIKAKRRAIAVTTNLADVFINGGAVAPELKIESDGSAIVVDNGSLCRLHIEDGVNLDIKAGDYGISFIGTDEKSEGIVKFDDNSKTVIDAQTTPFSGTPYIYAHSNCSVILRGSDEFGSLSGVSGLSLDDGIEFALKDATVLADYFGDGSKCLLYQKSMEPVTGWLEMRHLHYYFQIADVKVSEMNVDEPIESTLIKGDVDFDKTLKRLTLNNATVTGVVITKDDVLTRVDVELYDVSELVLIGSNTINNVGLSQIGNDPVTIMGQPGSLKTRSVVGNNMYLKDCTIIDAIINNQQDMTIENCTLSGGYFYSSGSSTTTINKCVVMADVASYNKTWEEEAGEEGDPAIRNCGDLTIKDSYIEAIGTSYGYLGMQDGPVGSLTIENSTVQLSVAEGGTATAKGYNLKLVDDMDLAGKGVDYTLFTHPTTKAFEVRDYGTINPTTKKVVFEIPAEKRNYGIKVGSTYVTGLNLDDVKDEGLKSGHISYDEKSHTLTLDNVQLEDVPIDIPANSASTLKLVGNNTMDGCGVLGYALKATDLLTITSADGQGTLTIGGESVMSGMDLPGGVFIDQCGVTVTALGKAIDLWGTGSLNMGNATLQATGTGAGSIVGVMSFELDGQCKIVTPDQASWNPSTGNVELWGELVKTTVTIEPFYDITIGTTAVSRRNYADIKDATVQKGKIAYDPETSTLTLDGVTMTYEGTEFVDAISIERTEPTTVMILGDNSIKNFASGLRGTDELTITGKGSGSVLTIEAKGFGIASNGITISDLSTTVQAGEVGVTAFSAGELTVDNASLSATASSDWGGAIKGILGLTLNSAILMSPSGAALNPETGNVELAGSVVKTIVISKLKPGDVNGDGIVNIVDVTMTIDNILGKSPKGFNATAADVNGDKTVNIVDVTSIIDIILKAK